MSENRSILRKALGRTDIIALGFGTMVGWIWIVLTTTWLTYAGFWGTIIAFIIGACIIALIGLAYGELTSALPLSGGEMVFAYRAAGRRFGMITGWIMVLAYLSIVIWEGIALANAIDYLLPIPDKIYLWDIGGEPVYLSWAVIGVIGGLIMMLLNLFGTRPAIIFQVMATIAIIGMGIMVMLGGITFGSVENIGQSFTNISGIFYVMLLLPSMLIGFDVIPQSAEEMNIAERDMGKMMIVCILISSVWYLMIIIAVGLGAPQEVRGTGSLPVADACAYIFSNNTFGAIMVCVGLLGILTTWNGFFMGATRLLFAMGRARILPKVFGRTSKKYNTPWPATLVVGCICIVAPFLGGRVLNWMVDISSVCALFVYCCVTYSMLMLRMKEPELKRPFQAGKSLALPVTIFIMTIVYFVIYIFYSITGRNYSIALIIVAVWIAAGVIMSRVSDAHGNSVTPAEREHLIFGDKYARFIKERSGDR